MLPPRPLLPYLENGKPHPPRHGHCGAVDLRFEKDSRGKSILRYLDRHAPLIVQQALYFDAYMPELPCVYILSSGGPCIEGDRLRQNFHVGDGASAFISTGAASKIAEMERDYCDMQQDFILEKEAYLEFLPEPVIPCRGARYNVDTRIRIDPSATLCYAEVYTDGRRYYGTGEHFDYDILSIRTNVTRGDGELLFRDQWCSRPKYHPLQSRGIMQEYSILGNVLALTPLHHAEAIYRQITPCDTPEGEGAIGICQLPNECGLLIKVLGKETENVQRKIREICSMVRQEIKGVPIPDEFPWRSFTP